MDEVDRQAMQEELDALVEEINDIAGRTEFNTQTLIDGSFQNKVFHIGANKGQNITVNIDAMNAEGIGLNEEITVTVEKNKYTTESETYAHDATDLPTEVTVDTEYSGDVNLEVVRDEDGNVAAFKVGDEYFTAVSVDDEGAVTGTTAVDQDTFDINEKITETDTLESVNIGSREAADASVQIIDDAINTVSSQRSKLGAIQNRLEHTINNLGASAENLTAAESRIRDTDMAKEMMEFTKNNILTQSAQAMLAQAQQVPQGVLQLLR